MIKIENISTYGWETAIRGMRNPMNSWDKSDSYLCKKCINCEVDPSDCPIDGTGEDIDKYYSNGCYIIGENDMKLMKSLFKGGTEHRKYLRFINVTMDITAPLYWWKEFDTYKIGTNCNSCSTMHKIHAKEFTLDDFSCEHLIDTDKVEIVKEDWVDVSPDESGYDEWDAIEFVKMIVRALNVYRGRYLETKDKKYWWQMIQLLPTSYNQRRTIQMNYEVAVRMIEQRKNHKLDEWHDMVEVLLNLPYMKKIMGVE